MANSILGTWAVTQQTIVGTSESTFVFTEADGEIKLEILGSKMVLTPVAVTQSGDVVTMTLDITKPLPTRVTIVVDVTPTHFEGKITARFLPSGKLTGDRIQTENAPENAPAAPVAEAAPAAPEPAFP
ncbi:MAG: hypothetical protein J7480_07525, partial [Microbacteriaceae bacterium]|nr:hypothetical protein [Microbacteriaceae bacterium]